MRKINLIFIFLLVNSFILPQLKEDIPGKQIITSDMIKSAGIISLSDIVNLSDKWNYSTVDGFTKLYSANNLSTFQRQNCVLMVDGQKYDIGIFDVQNLNLLPISISQIDFVEIYSLPQIVDGNFIEGGMIHFHTKKPVRSISAYINEIVGNETGDPGPYRYTELATPNIDKVGPFFSLGVNYGSKNWFLKTAYKNEETFDTDPFILQRVSYLNKDNAKSTLNSGWGILSAKWFGGITEISGGITNHDDFFFFKQAGYEIPISRLISHIGINGTTYIDNNISLKYNANYAANEINNRENKIDFNFDLKSKTISADIEGDYHKKYFDIQFGLGIEKNEMQSIHYFGKDSFLRRKAYSSLTLSPSSNYSQIIGFYYVKEKNFNSFKGNLFNYWALNRYNIIATNCSFYEHHTSEDMSYWSWYNKGYNLQKELGVDYNIFGTPKKSRTFSADIIYSIKPDSLIFLELSGNFRYFNNYYIEKQAYQYSNESAAFFGPVNVYQNEDLKTLGGSITFSQRLSSQFNHKLSYCYQQNLSGTEVFKEIWKAIPNHNFAYTVEYNPSSSFGIWAKIKYLSSSVWYDYKYSEYQSNSIYNYEIKPKLLLDLSIQKWFFNRTLWVNLLLRNVFNQDEKYNPAGINFALTDFIQVHFYFDTIPE